MAGTEEESIRSRISEDGWRQIYQAFKTALLSTSSEATEEAIEEALTAVARATKDPIVKEALIAEIMAQFCQVARATGAEMIREASENLKKQKGV